MNYKSLFKRVFALITTPSKEWEEIARENSVSQVMSGFVYPLIGLCCTSVFLGSFIGNGITRESLGPALMMACGYGVALFASFFLSAYVIGVIDERYLKRTRNKLLSYQLVGYSMVVLFVLNVIVGLFSEFLVLKWLLQFYTLKIVWEGTDLLMKVEDSKRLTYTILVSVVVLASPVIIQKVFELLSSLAANG